MKVMDCQHIKCAISLSLNKGNEIYKITENSEENAKKIIDMYYPLSSSLKRDIDIKCKKLRYWEFSGVPHNPAENGYTCVTCNVVLIFPSHKTPKIMF